MERKGPLSSMIFVTVECEKSKPAILDPKYLDLYISVYYLLNF